MFTISEQMRGKDLTKSSARKMKTVLFLLIVITSTLTFLSVSDVRAETEIISITPSQGNVGTTVQLKANITTPDGPFQIRFDGELIPCENATGNATGNSVDVSFKIPSAPAGNHNITIFDVENNTESVPKTFTILTSYSLKAYTPEPPMQLQEGDSVNISLNITGGERSKTYFVNVTVQTPTNVSYSVVWNASTNDKGEGLANVTYPDDFKPVNPEANTNFTGEYKVFSNVTKNETETFFIGLTNSTEYHRFDYVGIRATGYQPDENVTVTISFEGKTLNSTTITAVGGVINYTSWMVPSNATIGIYTLNITSTFGNTTKNPPDIQNFTVPGFDVNVTTTNLADEPVPNVIVNAFENVTLAANETSNVEGIAFLKLEIGNYTLEAYYKNQKVGVLLIEITNATALSFPCNLTNLRIHVIGIVEGTEIQMPEVNLFLKPENQTATTNLTGTAVFHSLLPNVSYTINASRYNFPFNVTTIPTLFVNENAVAWYNITIRYPSFTLKVDVLNPNANNQPINNATVKVQELITGLYYERKTNESGKAVFDPLLGKYKIEIYEENGIKLNETSFELFEDKNLTIYCNLYGLVIKVKVIDYFGQPISNVNVKLRYCETVKLNLTFSNRTQGDGVATFTNIVGGDMQAYIYLTDQTQPCVVKTFSVKKSTTVVIKIEKYVVLAGLLVETSQLAITILIVATVILVLLLEIYRRKRVKPRKAGTENK